MLKPGVSQKHQPSQPSSAIINQPRDVSQQYIIIFLLIFLMWIARALTPGNENNIFIYILVQLNYFVYILQYEHVKDQSQV